MTRRKGEITGMWFDEAEHLPESAELRDEPYNAALEAAQIRWAERARELHEQAVQELIAIQQIELAKDGGTAIFRVWHDPESGELRWDFVDGATFWLGMSA